jgi:hypothetical protein
MPKLEFDQNDQQLIDSTSYIVPEKEYEQGDYEALFKTFNSLGAAINRGNYERMEVDTSAVSQTPFTRDSLRSYLETSKYSQEVQNRVMMSPVQNWEEALQRAEYVNNVLEMESQVQSNFSTAGMIAAGLPMAIVDIDMLAYSPALAGINKLKKISQLNLTSRISRTVDHTITGGVIGGTSMATYEGTTGIYRDDSVTHATFLGMLLSGTLGWFLSKSDTNPALINEVDGKTGKVLSKEESKLRQLEEAQAQKRALDEVIDEAAAIKEERAATKQGVRQSEVADREAELLQKRTEKERLEKQSKESKGIFDTARTALKTARDGMSSITKQIRELTGEMTVAKRDSVKATKLADERSVIAKELTPVKTQITKLTKKIEALKGSRTKEANEARAALKEKLGKQQEKMDKIEARLARVDTRAGKLTPDANLRVQQGLDRLGKLRTQEYETQLAIDKAAAGVEKSQAAYSKASKAAKEYKTGVRKEDVKYTEATQKLRERLNSLDEKLSGEALKEALRSRNAITRDIEKMKSDDFNLSTLYGIRREQQNYVKKLEKELEEINQAKDFRQSSTFKRLPSWAQKFIISPIEKLLNSENELVSGFASLLHSGTLHHGKINTNNAWNIKTMLDDSLNWMQKRVTGLYHQALKDGSFTGKLSEFDAAVSREVYRVTGAMQRELNDAIPATITGKDRLELMKQRAASVRRNHRHENQYVNKAVDEVLDYYESIFVRGSKLGMPAFGGIGKGYAKRIYDRRTFESLGKQRVTEIFVEAQRAKAIADGSVLGKADMDEFRAIGESTYDKVISGAYRREQITSPLGMPRQSTTSSLKQRQIEAFDDDLIDLLEHDFRSTTALYGLGTHGRLALKERLGVDNDEQLEKVLEQLGASSKEMDNLRVVIETIKGTREISKNPFDPFTRVIKGVSTFSSAMHTMAFAIPTVTEIASVAKEFGWAKTIDGLVGKPQEVYRLYRYGTPSEKNTIEMMVSYGDAVFAHRANRFDVESTFDSVGRIQEFMDDVVRREAIFGGLLPVTDMLRMTTASLSVDFLAQMSVKKQISKTDEMRLNDMGFGLEDLSRIRETLKVQPDGRIGNPDRKTWGDLDREITFGVKTMVERTILHPNGATLPKFMTNMNEGQFIPRVMMKFMRFPIESHERLLMRGIQEADAKQLLALGGNIAMWTAILSMKDALKDEDKQKYSGDEGMNQLMMDSFLYNSFTAGVISFGDTASGLLTGENLTNDYRYRIGGAVQSDWESAQKGEFRLAVPFHSINVGDAVSNAANTMFGLDELNKD